MCLLSFLYVSSWVPERRPLAFFGTKARPEASALININPHQVSKKEKHSGLWGNHFLLPIDDKLYANSTPLI